MIFILGANGFVGSAFVRLFESMKLPYTAITRETYKNYVGKSCDTLINAAGNSKKWLSDKDPTADFDASVRMVRASLTDFKYKKYILISSCDVYSNLSNPDYSREDSNIDQKKLSAYGFHKWLAEQCVEKFAPDWLVFRLGGMVGPGLKKNPIYDMMSGDAIHLSLQSQLQYMETDFVARAVYKVLTSDKKNERYNIAGTGTVKLSEIHEWTGKRSPVPNGLPTVHYEVSNKKISQLIPASTSKEIVMSFINLNKKGIAS